MTKEEKIKAFNEVNYKFNKLYNKPECKTINGHFKRMLILFYYINQMTTILSQKTINENNT
jgi:hypothetical protein